MTKKETKPSEHKSFPFIELKIDEEQGIVEHLIAIHGVLDLGNDISHPGSFAKTLQERGLRAKVLDKHRTDSVMAVVGKPLAMKEVDRSELPDKVLKEYPEATGGVWAQTQFLMETPEGKGAFQRIKAGAVDEFSYGYDAIVYDHEDLKTKEGEPVTARNLREVKLYEYSPVIWGMNPAATTIAAKDGDEKELVVRCPKCGFETSAPIELDDLMTCPKCETQMERVEAKEPEDDPEQEKVEVTENFIHVPAPGEQGKHKGHRIRTITVSASKGIKGRYCGECKKMISYLFDKDKWDVTKAKAWVKKHEKALKELSHDDIRNAIYEQIQPPSSRIELEAKKPYYHIEDVFDDYAVIKGSDGTWYKLPFTVSEDEVKFGEPIEMELTEKKDTEGDKTDIAKELLEIELLRIDAVDIGA